MKSYHLAALAVLFAPAAVPAQETTSFEYDAQGRLIKSAKVGGPNDGKEKCTTYDPAGNRTEHEVTDASCSGGEAPPNPGGGGGGSNPPVTSPDTGIMLTCSTDTFNVTSNDVDPTTGQPPDIQSVSGPLPNSTDGTTSVEVTSLFGTGSFTFNYVVVGSTGLTAGGTLTVTVNAGGPCA